jgi:hypothetical protein
VSRIWQVLVEKGGWHRARGRKGRERKHQLTAT